MGEFGPALIAGVPFELEEGTVTVIGHGNHLLTSHLDVEVTADGETETLRWHNGDLVEVGTYVYLVRFKRFEKYQAGLEVAHLVTLGTETDPEFKRAEAAAAAAEDSAAEAGGLVPLV